MIFQEFRNWSIDNWVNQFKKRKNNLEKFKNIIQMYIYQLNKTAFIADCMTSLKHLKLDQHSRQLVNYTQSQIMIFHLKKLIQSFKNKINYFQLNNFEEFLDQKSSNKFLIDKLNFDLERWKNKQQKFSIGINWEKVKQPELLEFLQNPDIL